MQPEPSKGRPFKSRFGGGYICGNQYLAENMCARIAKRDRVELGDRFWRQEKWEREFRLQVNHAKFLLADKGFSIEAVIAALRTTRGQKFYSLGARKQLVPLVEAEQEKLNNRRAAAAADPKAEPAPESPPAQAAPPRPAFTPPGTVLSKLKNL